MFKDFIGEKINVLVASRVDHILEYYGTLTNELEDSIVLTNATISFMMLSFQKGMFGENMNKYRENIDKVIINKKYIISCNK